MRRTARAGTKVSVWRPTFGATADDRHTTFRVWASAARSVTLVIGDPEQATQRVPLAYRDQMFEGRVEGTGHGTLYRYELDGREAMPDPASRFQPRGVHGPSQVIDWTPFPWSDEHWKGVPFDDLVIYELHVGTFTPQGSFLAVIDRLPHLAALGVTAIELMPIAAFAGRRNWGYDGAALYAPASQYGRPADLQQLVDAAHAVGIAVLLDVVYNHLGPDGAYLAAFSPDFFSSRHQSPWGDGVNLDGPGSDMVRRFLVENALHWIHEFHVDGLRLDAIHALADERERPFVAEVADAVHAAGAEAGRQVHVIAEDERNLATVIRPPGAGGLGVDGVWSDDFHHEVHRLLSGERAGYYADYSGQPDAIAEAINRGWVFTGERSSYTGEPRGSDPTGLRLSQFIFCLQNHDQVGNRALGERLEHLVNLPDCRAAAAVLLLAPETPLLFMGQEWAASTPFLYFTDHHDDLGRLVTEGRRREFERFPAFSDPAGRERIPDPQGDAAFERSRLRWEEIDREPHRSMLALYRALIDLRGETSGDRLVVSPTRAAWTVDQSTLAVACGGRSKLLLVARLRGSGDVTFEPPADAAGNWQVAMTTEGRGFAADPTPPRVETTGRSITIHFARPSAVIFRDSQPGERQKA